MSITDRLLSDDQMRVIHAACECIDKYSLSWTNMSIGRLVNYPDDVLLQAANVLRDDYYNGVQICVGADAHYVVAWRRKAYFAISDNLGKVIGGKFQLAKDIQGEALARTPAGIGILESARKNRWVLWPIGVCGALAVAFLLLGEAPGALIVGAYFLFWGIVGVIFLLLELPRTRKNHRRLVASLRALGYIRDAGGLAVA